MAETINNLDTGEKTFTQEQVNAIVGERLAKEKAKGDAALVERERELARRELLMTAKERLAEKGLPAALIDAINVSSPEALDKSISIIAAELGKQNTQPPTIHGMKPYTPDNAPPDSAAQRELSIRKAMGLK